MFACIDNKGDVNIGILTVIRLLEIFKNCKSVKCLNASVGNSCRKLDDRSNCSKLKIPEIVNNVN